MSYTYASFQTALALEMIIPNALTTGVSDPNFQAILPTIIDYGEQRCYRELDLLYATTTEMASLTAGLRIIDLSGLPTYLVIPENFNVITPSGILDPDLGARNQLAPVSKEFLDAVYNSSQGATVPRHFAMLNDVTVLVGPWPDQNYAVECVGKYRPIPLYNAAPDDGTQTTFLTQHLPDLFLAACMVSAMGYRHNFGAQSDDPRSAMSWETQYTTLLQSAMGEETRKKFHGFQGGTSEKTPAPNP